MVPYIFTFFIPAFIALLQPVQKPWNRLFWWIPTAIFFIIFIGLRDNVGSDWENYMMIFTRDASHMSYSDALHHDDPAFYFLMVWVYKMGWTIHIVYLISALLFTSGLTLFIRRLPNPWLALTMAMSYTILTLGMGYVRQGIGLGFAFWAITAMTDRKFVKFFILISIGAAFHKSAVLMLGFGLFYGGKSKYLKAIAAILMGIGIYAAFMSGNEETYVKLYVDKDMQSKGAIIRVFMNVIPAFFFLYFRKIWKEHWPDGYTLWYLMALASVFAFPSVFILSTVTDRVALYLIPFQFVVFSSLPILLKGIISPKLTTGLIIGYYGMVYFVWLLFAQWAFAWLPYQNILSVWLVSFLGL